MDGFFYEYTCCAIPNKTAEKKVGLQHVSLIPLYFQGYQLTAFVIHILREQKRGLKKNSERVLLVLYSCLDLKLRK